MTTTYTFWSASWEEDAGGAFGNVRTGDLGNFDSQDKAKSACQAAASRLLTWKEPTWAVGLWSFRTEEDARHYLVLQCTLTIQ